MTLSFDNLVVADLCFLYRIHYWFLLGSLQHAAASASASTPQSRSEHFLQRIYDDIYNDFSKNFRIFDAPPQFRFGFRKANIAQSQESSDYRSDRRLVQALLDKVGHLGTLSERPDSYGSLSDRPGEAERTYHSYEDVVDSTPLGNLHHVGRAINKYTNAQYYLMLGNDAVRNAKLFFPALV